MSPQQHTPEDGAADRAGHIRGSAVLLFGRFLAMGINLVTQVLVVRALTRADYGAFAYALSLVGLGRVAVSLGHKRALPRFLAIDDERGEHGRLAGTLSFAVTWVVASAVVLITGLVLVAEHLQGVVVDHPLAITLLLIMVALAPLQALDDLSEGILATFSRPRAIFFRKHVVAPLLQLGVVLALIAAGAGVVFLAVGYVLAALLGVGLYAALIVTVLRRRRLLGSFRRGKMTVPAREFLGFSFPLLTHDLAYLSMTAVSVALLGFFSTAGEVAAFRAIRPAAMLNQVVLTSFALLFTPLASRLFAKGDMAGMRTAYRHTAIWVAVLSFPIIALTFPLAEPVTVLLFGERYRDAGLYLALLSLGYYLNAALGFNSVVLQVYGRLRFVVGVNAAVAVLNVALSLLLIPRWHALGASIAIAVSLVTQNLLNQWGLSRLLDIPSFDRRYIGTYGGIAGGLAVLYLVQATLHPHWAVSVLLAAVVSAAVLAVNRRHLRIAETVPELLRIPGARRFLS